MDSLLEYRMLGNLRRMGVLEDRAGAIFEKMEGHGRVVVSTSWGKDSVVLMDLGMKYLRRPVFFHMRNEYSLPGYDEVMGYFLGRGIDYREISLGLGLKDMIAWLKAFGLPHERSRYVQGKAVSMLKKDPARIWMMEEGFRVMALGMRGAENPNTRGRLFRYRGMSYRKEGLIYFNPLFDWSGKDVWAYIAKQGLPFNRRIYDAETHGLTREVIRNTGWLSTDGAVRGRIAWLKHHFPDQYLILAREWPEVREFL